MPLTSAFDPFGMFEFSSKPSHAERIYEALVRAMGDGDNYSLDFDDNHHSAKLYAMAMGLAAIQYTLDRANNNRDPLKATEMLPTLEAEYRITPAPDATLPERRAVLAAKMMITRGPRREYVEGALKLILGDLFVAYHPLASTAAVPLASPELLANSDGTFTDPNTPLKLRTLDVPISNGLGAPQWIDTTYLAGSPDWLIIGDVLTVDPGLNGRTESVTVEDIRAPFGTGQGVQLTFTKAHEAGAVIRSGPFPLWTSTDRHNLIVLDSTAFDETGTTLEGDPFIGLNTELKRQISELLEQVLRIVSTYLITQESTAGVVGPITVGDGIAPLTYGLIGITPLGTTTI